MPSRPRRPLTPLALAVLLGLAALLSPALPAEDWPQWRGPHGNGVSDSPTAPITWEAGGEQILWRTPLPGPSGATPVIAGDHIFLTSADEDRLELLCFDRQGKQRWRRVVSSGNRKVRGDEGNLASPSPVTDGKHVWTFMGTGELACYDVNGSLVWKFNVQERYGKLRIAFGMTSTPVLDDGVLYLQLIHGEGDPKTREARVVALKAATGEEIWQRERASDATRECEHSYASPTLYDDGEKKLLITHGADYVIAYDVKDGLEVWRCGELNLKDNYNPTLRFVASPTVAEGMIVVPSAKNGPVLAISPDGAGDITQSPEHRLWTRDKNTPDVPSPLIHNGLVYLCRENGTLICLDQKTGEELYQVRVHSQRHRASPVYAAGHIYMSARDGRVSVVKAGREYKLVAQNDINEPLSATPVIVDGVVYLRTFDALYAIGGQR